MKKQQYILHLNGLVHGRGDYDYMVELMTSYTDTCDMYGRDSVSFIIEKVGESAPADPMPDLLEKAERALTMMTATGTLETPVLLSFAELRGIRRELLVANYRQDLAAQNLRAGQNIQKTIRSRVSAHGDR